MTTASRLLSISASLLALLGTGCSAHAEIPEVVVTQSEIVFDGVPKIEGITIPTSLTTSFDHPEGFEMPDFLTTELRPLGAVITAEDPNQNLSFIESLSLTIGSRSEDAPPPANVANYTRGSMDEINSVDVSADSAADILKYWKTKTAYYQLNVNGQMPEEAWGVVVTVKFGGSLSISSQ